MHYVIAGGMGFLGSHLADYILAQNEYNTVFLIDDLSTGSYDNIKHMPLGRVRYHKGDIRNHEIGSQDFQKPDVIFNLACPASPDAYQAIPMHTLDTCYTGTKNLLIQAAQWGCKYVHASTSEVYGDPEVHPQVETYWGNVNSFGPRSCYDEGKRVAEALIYTAIKGQIPQIMQANRLDTPYPVWPAVDARIARIFNTYGPRMQLNDGRVVSNFLVQALQDNDITIYGDGTQTRSFCFVDDTVRGLFELGAAKSVDGPVNIGNPFESTIKQIAEKCIAITKSYSKIIHLPLPKDDPTRRNPCITKAEQVLGWSPKTSLDDGLLLTAAYFQRKLNAISQANVGSTQV